MVKRFFVETRMFAYHRKLNFSKGLFAIFLGVILVAMAGMFIAFRNSDIWIVVITKTVVSNITSNISASSLLGILYSSIIGGLFFIFLPMEVLFARFVNSGYPLVTVFVVYFTGLTIAYTLNYFLGARLANFSKKLITPRKFYSLKGKLNRYGGLVVFLFNATPLPSQILAALLGVFKYNKTRFYIYFFLGQGVKCTAIALGVSYLF